MPIIQAGGIATGTSTTRAKGSIEHGGAAQVASSAHVLARGNAEVAPSGLCLVELTALGHVVQLVKVVLVEAITSTRIRITFDRPMLKDAALLNKYNYQVSPITPGAATIFVSEVEPQNRIKPEFVDLIISEMTDGATYRCEVNPDGPTDPEGVPLSPGDSTYDYTGIGIAPTVSQVIAVSENRIDVVFSETMRDNDDIKDPSKYSFDGGLSVIDVLEFDGTTAKLVTSDQASGYLYTLTINP